MSTSTYYRYRISEPSIGRPEIDAVMRCLTAGELTQSGGQSVATFESKLATYLGISPYRVVACTSGTSALHLALLTAGIQPGDRVAVPALTYVATVAALRYVGAIPVFIDVDPRTWTLDIESLLQVRDSVSAIIPVDLYGVAALDDPDDLALFEDHVVIRDACQSFGSAVDFSHPAVFSFYANKLITTGGEGGAYVTTSIAAANIARKYRGQGQSTDRRYWHELVGYNYRMTAMQAAFGTAQLSHVLDVVSQRKRVVDTYRTVLADYERQFGQDATTIDWLFSLLVPRDCDRDKVATYLARIHGIETRPVFPSIAEMPPYVQFRTHALPVTDDICARGLSLPTHPLLNSTDASTIAFAFVEAVNSPVTKRGA